MENPVYYVSTCPETGKQFLCQLGVDGNIAELNPATVASMLVTYRQQEKTKALLKLCRKSFRKSFHKSFQKVAK
jgi:hypothetical protein